MDVVSEAERRISTHNPSDTQLRCPSDAGESLRYTPTFPALGQGQKASNNLTAESTKGVHISLGQGAYVPCSLQLLTAESTKGVHISLGDLREPVGFKKESKRKDELCSVGSLISEIVVRLRLISIPENDVGVCRNIMGSYTILLKERSYQIHIGTWSDRSGHNCVFHPTDQSSTKTLCWWTG